MRQPTQYKDYLIDFLLNLFMFIWSSSQIEVSKPSQDHSENQTPVSQTPHNHNPNQTQYLQNILLGYNPTQQQPASHFSMGQVGATSLLSDRQHINSLFATHTSDPTPLERAAISPATPPACTTPPAPGQASFPPGSPRTLSTAPRSNWAGSPGTSPRSV